ncbi:hypothetical protein KL86PLE_70022 [uncultured Pleomorphomonas sp.]|uniref:Uncharacterized protein n=1 Tax=uncultured Pleomorphomonas sp. TaxID=442121 RepID=A0A212LLG6_9HYPH|nr:hypothetical protein KL86PLE_70022 [uncultured Pleomorphomonas sp.]
MDRAGKPAHPSVKAAQSISAVHGNAGTLYLFESTYFLHANRHPLRSEMLRDLPFPSET